MHRPLFLRIVNAVEQHDDYFQLKRNASHQKGLSCLQKATAVFRMLTYGVPADATDEYVRIGESTTLKSLRRFVKAVIDVFEEELSVSLPRTILWSLSYTYNNFRGGGFA
jgi:hypothetical protein